MKRKLVLTESELVNLAMRIAEQVNFDLYDDEDFLDAFFQMFRMWIKRFKGEKNLDYPMSYLLKKYSKDFVQHTLGDEGLKKLVRWEEGDDLDELWEDNVISKYDVITFVQMAIEKNKYNLPKLFQQEKFTEKYKSIIDNFLKEDLELPNYVKVTIDEPNPHYFSVKVEVDTEKWVKDPNQVTISSGVIEKRIKGFFQDFLGLEFGYIKHGQSEIHTSPTEFLGLDEWVKNDLNKKLKKDLKTTDGSRLVKSLKLEKSTRGLHLTPTFFSDARWNSRQEVVDKYNQKLKEMGYGPNLRVQR